MSVQARKTRLKGTTSKKPCFGCGKTKDRFEDFKPRWAGCTKHTTERGRRFFQQGCGDCEKIVNGNIRQPRCIECDKSRQKKRTPTPLVTPDVPTIETLAAVVADEPTTAITEVVEQVYTEDLSAPPLPLTGTVTEGKSSAASANAESVVDAPVSEVEPEDVVGLPERAESPIEVVVVEVEADETPAPVVAVPPPAVKATPPAVPTPSKKVASKADLFALFAGDENAEETKPPF